MSIKLGRAKNWGSRSGRRKSPKEKGLVHRLTELGLPNDLLLSIISADDSLRAAAAQLVERRAPLAAKCDKPELAFKTRLGRLYRGDCVFFLKSLEDESVDCIFADPPFNLSKDYAKSASDDLRDDEYLEWTREWIELCCAKLKEGGALFVYNIPRWATYISNILNQRLTFRHWIAVDITFSMPIPSRLYPSHYALLYYIKGKKPNRFSPSRTPIKTCVRCGQEQNDYGGYKMKMNPNGINLRDVWTDIPPVRHTKHKNRDANELSLKLMDRILDVATAEGDLVLDPFGGSGTTFIAAELKGRRWLGTELGDCEPIRERFARIDEERAKLDRIRRNINVLFTDKAIQARAKHGLPLNTYRIANDQIERALNGKGKGVKKPASTRDRALQLEFSP